jgi:hypothetical protein
VCLLRGTDWKFYCNSGLVFILSYLVGMRFSLDLRRPGREADHSTPSSADAENIWKCLCVYVCMFVCVCVLFQIETNFVSVQITLYTGPNFIHRP